MKVKLIDENNIIVFLSSYKMNSFDLNSTSSLESELKDLFKKLNLLFDLQLHGYYNVSIYIDKYYGMILTLNKEELEYTFYDIDEVDMRILVYRNDFIYLISSFIDIEGDYTIYNYKNKYYLKLNNILDNYNMGKLLEYSEVIYDNVDEIIKYGTILKNANYVI